MQLRDTKLVYNIIRVSLLHASFSLDLALQYSSLRVTFTENLTVYGS